MIGRAFIWSPGQYRASRGSCGFKQGVAAVTSIRSTMLPTESCTSRVNVSFERSMTSVRWSVLKPDFR